jgi:hypothetical protein
MVLRSILVLTYNHMLKRSQDQVVSDRLEHQRERAVTATGTVRFIPRNIAPIRMVNTKVTEVAALTRKLIVNTAEHAVLGLSVVYKRKVIAQLLAVRIRETVRTASLTLARHPVPDVVSMPLMVEDENFLLVL